MKKNKSLIRYLIIVSLLSISSILVLFKSGFFVTDDGSWMVIRFSAFFEALRNGQFPVRFLPRLNNGYGYPVANFLYPLFMYIGVPIHVLGFSFVNTIKIIFGLSLVSSSIFSFLWLRKKFDNLSSLIGSLVYLYFPYHLWDVYKRGSIGEVLALAIVPFVLWQIERSSLFWSSLGIAFLILSHNSLAFIFLPIIILYFLIRKKDIRKNILSVAFGLGVSCFFWLPALYERKFVVFDKVSVSNFSEYFINSQNINLVGLVFLLALFLTLFIRRQIKSKIYWLFFILSIIIVFLIYPVSSFAWPVIAPYIQFPFRLISILVLTTAFLVSFQLNLLKGKLKNILIVIYLTLLIIGARDFIYPKEYTNYPDSFYSTNVDTTTVKNEYMPKWVKTIPSSIPEEKAEVIQGDAEISSLINNGNKISFNIDAKEKSLVLINTVYYPGWEVVVDNKKTEIDYDSSGLIEFSVNNGSYLVEVNFRETLFRCISNAISAVSLLLLVLLIATKRKL